MAEPPDDWKRHLGRKVSIRYHLHGDPAHPFSEAIGLVQSVKRDDRGVERLTLVKRTGDAVSVAVDDVVAAKIFPA